MRRNSIVHKEIYGFSGKFHCAVWTTASLPYSSSQLSTRLTPELCYSGCISLGSPKFPLLHSLTVPVFHSYPFSPLEKCSAVSIDNRSWATRDATSKRRLTFHTWGYFCLWMFGLLPPWNFKLKFQPLSSLRSFLTLKLVINTHPGRVSYP